MKIPTGDLTSVTPIDVAGGDDEKVEEDEVVEDKIDKEDEGLIQKITSN